LKRLKHRWITILKNLDYKGVILLEKHIKQRIYSIRKKESTDGYKYSKLGVIPIDWTIKEIKDIATINPQKTLLQNEKMVSFLGMAGVSENAKVIELETKPYGEVSKGFTSFIDNDILVAKITPCFENGKGALVKNLINGVGFGSTEFHVIRCEKPEDIKFVFYHTTSHRFRKTGEKNMTGTAGQKRVPADFIENYLIQYPSNADERAKIAEVLSTWDKAIELKEKLIEEKKKQKTGLMQKLLTGKVRLPGFKGEWKEVKLGKVLKDKTEKTTENDQYQILSCTKDGIVSQSDHFNKQIASTNNIGYKILKKGEVVLSPMNLWLGGIDISTFDVGIVSPAYKVYEVDYSIIGENYLRNLLRSDYMIAKYDSISQKGASVVRRNLSIKEFESLTIKLPTDFNEMNAIDKLIGIASKEIALLEAELKNLKLQKKGLMQLLLTGIIRVNTQENEKR